MLFISILAFFMGVIATYTILDAKYSNEIVKNYEELHRFRTKSIGMEIKNSELSRSIKTLSQSSERDTATFQQEIERLDSLLTEARKEAEKYRDLYRKMKRSILVLNNEKN